MRQEHAALGESAIAEAEIRYRWTESLSQDIVSLNTTRILFAEQMALVKDLMPPSIQLASLTLRLDTKTQQLQPPPPAAAGGESVARPAKPRRPKKLEVLTMRFEGQAVGDRPEMEVDGFLNKVREDNVFALTLDDVQLQSIARASLTDPKTGVVSDPRAFFVVECTLRGEQ